MDEQTSQSQPNTGTPVDVPLPKKTSRLGLAIDVDVSTLPLQNPQQECSSNRILWTYHNLKSKFGHGPSSVIQPRNAAQAI